MSTQTNQQGFLRFLKDERFIQWKLLPNDELNTYWADFLEKNPDEQPNFAKAEKHFQNIKLSSYYLPKKTKKEAIKRLEKSFQGYKRKRQLRIFAYAASTCLAALVLSNIYFQVIKPNGRSVASADVIVGSKLSEQDIQLVTNDQTTAFNGNIHIEMAKNGIAQVKSTDNKTEKVAMLANSSVKVVVPYGKSSVISLADGTKVWLNAGSTLKFPSKFNGSTREISLTGEMYIQVSPDKSKPFLVQTKNFSVEVLGTKFNVSAYENYTKSVSLLEGSVQLKSKTTNAVMQLSPNEQALYMQDGNFKKETVNAENAVTWTKGYIVLDKTPISEVLLQVERYYNLSFNFENDANLQKRTCSGKLSISYGLDDVMNALGLLTGTQYTRKDNTIYINNKK